jgi:predicted Zn finger-like uncharacterized protein
MRIACPNCGAEYEVPDAMLASGPRMLKCARCDHRFQAEAPRAAEPGPSSPEAGAVVSPGPGAVVSPGPGAVVSPEAGAVVSPEPGAVVSPEPGAAASPAPPPEPEPPPRPDVVAPLRPPPPEPPPSRPPPTRGPSQHSPIEAVAADPPRGGAALALAWLLSLAALGGAGYAAFLYRAEIMQAWPPAARLFAALGLA